MSADQEEQVVNPPTQEEDAGAVGGGTTGGGTGAIPKKSALPRTPPPAQQPPANQNNPPTTKPPAAPKTSDPQKNWTAYDRKLFDLLQKFDVHNPSLKRVSKKTLIKHLEDYRSGKPTNDPVKGMEAYTLMAEHLISENIRVNNQLKADNDKAKDDFQRLVGEHRDLQSAYLDLESQVDRSRQIIQDQENGMVDLRDRESDLRDELLKVQSKLANTHKGHDKLSQDLTHLSNALDDERRNNQALKDRIKQLEGGYTAGGGGGDPNDPNDPRKKPKKDPPGGDPPGGPGGGRGPPNDPSPFKREDDEKSHHTNKTVDLTVDEIVDIVRRQQTEVIGRTQTKDFVGYIPFPNIDLPASEQAQLATTIPESLRKQFLNDLKDKSCSYRNNGDKGGLLITTLCNRIKDIAEEHRLGPMVVIKMFRDKLSGKLLHDVDLRIRTKNPPEDIWRECQTNMKGVVFPQDASAKLHQMMDDPKGMPLNQLIGDIYNYTCYSNDEVKNEEDKLVNIATNARMTLKFTLQRHCASWIMQKIDEKERYLREMTVGTKELTRDPRSYNTYSKAIYQVLLPDTPIGTKSYHRTSSNPRAQGTHNSQVVGKRTTNDPYRVSGIDQSNPNRGGRSGNQRGFRGRGFSRGGTRAPRRPREQVSGIEGEEIHEVSAFDGPPHLAMRCLLCACGDKSLHTMYKDCDVYPGMIPDLNGPECPQCTGYHGNVPCKRPKPHMVQKRTQAQA